MRALVENFQYTSNGKILIACVENNDSVWAVVEMAKVSSIERLYIYSHKEELLEKINNQVNLEKENGLSLCAEVDTYHIDTLSDICDDIRGNIDSFFFDSSTSEFVIDFILNKYEPKEIYARIWENKIGIFTIWEKARTYSRHIYIQCVREGKTDVLDWTVNPQTDIELSVVFPVYNVSAYLDKCISTICEWKAPYVEFIFVNDGSKDNSAEIIEGYQKLDKRIKLVNKPNGGCASARKRGLEEAKGKYVGFIDPDDFIDPSMFLKLLRSALIGSYDFAYCGFNYYFENTKKIQKVQDTLCEPYISGTYDVQMIRQLICWLRVAIWRGIYKKELLNQYHISFYEEIKRFDDLPFKVEVLTKAKSVIAIPEYLYYYRLERPGQDVACDDERLKVHFQIFKCLDESFEKTKDQQLLDLLQVVKIQTHFYALEKIQKKYFKDYAKEMKKDLNAHAGFVRTAMLARKYTGARYTIAYFLLKLGWYKQLCRYLKK